MSYITFEVVHREVDKSTDKFASLQSRTGPCWNKPCTGRETCVPDGTSYRCDAGIADGEIGCPPYNFPEHGANLGTEGVDGQPIDVPTGSLHPVGSYLQVGCQYPYVTTHGDPNVKWGILCTDTMKWVTTTYRCISVAELCVHKLLENKFYPSRAQITVTSSVAWTDTDALLESGLGWFAAVNDDQQYIQVKLDDLYWIGGVITKGGSTGGNENPGWVKSYTVSYSGDCSNYEFVTKSDQDGSQSRTGSCWNKPCGVNETCVPDGDSYRCNPGIGDGNVGCPPYNFPELGEKLGITDVDGKPIDVPAGSVYPVGSSIKAGCEFPYVPIGGGPDAYWRITCYDTMRWESINYKCVSVTELCVHKILENKFYPSRVQITVTSSVAWTDTDALLESGLGWLAGTNDDQQYIQVQFDYPYWIGGVITKGGLTRGNGIPRWVKSYTVSYGWDCSNYEFVTKSDQNGSQIFQGNTDATTSVTNHFERQKSIKCLRVHPVDYEVEIIMRLELLTCWNYK